MSDGPTTPATDIVLAEWAREIQPSALQKMLLASSRPNILSLALGLPAAELFPAEDYTRALAQVLATDTRALQYGPPFTPLKKHIVALMAERGVKCEEDQIFLTAGAQQGMNLLVRLLLEPGGTVIMEELTYTGFQQVLEPYRPNILTVPTDTETGIDVSAVESLLMKGARPALIYCVTHGHNPLGSCISASKRARLVELAERYGVPIIEDDPYGFLSYEETAEPPMRAFDSQWVLYVGTFSKIMAPALRVGWIIAPQSLMHCLSIIKEASDIDMSTLNQRAISAYIEAGHLEAHLARLRREYKLRRDTMLKALREHFPAEASWCKPSCGVFIWAELNAELKTDELLERALIEEQVAFIPGEAFCAGEGGKESASRSMRLNFSHCSTALIEEGIARLARVLKAALSSTASSSSSAPRSSL
jgi:2-aminoadipate transaminase